MPRSLRRYSYANDSYVRTCTQCQREFPETAEHFAYNAPRGIFNSWCKPCVRAHRRNVTTVGPCNHERTFGVEIEFHGSAADVAREMTRVGLVCEVQAYNHRVSRTTWKIVPDGSVSRGAELVSPILSGTNGFDQLAKAGLALAAAGATVDRQTGLHVHHDVRNLTVSAFKLMISNWHSAQSAIDGLVSPSRREGNNTYCQPFEQSEVDYLTTHLTSTAQREVSNLINSRMYLTRYRCLNLQSYPKYGTVEIRQHQGTIDGEKITAWVKFGQAMITAAVEGTALAPLDTAALLSALPLDETTRSYLTRRTTKLARRTARV